MASIANSSGNLAVTFDQMKSILLDIFDNTGDTITNFPQNPVWTYLYSLITSLNNLVSYTESCMLMYGLTRLKSDIEQVQSIPLGLSAKDEQYLTDRSDAITSTITSLTSVCSAQVLAATNLYSGNPIVSDNNYWSYLSTFSEEAAPTNLSVSGFYTTATDNADAWERIKTALENSGASYSPTILDTLSYMQNVSTSQVAFGESYIALNAGISIKDLWNYVIVLPVLQEMASYFWNRLTSDSYQVLTLTKYGIHKTLLYCQQILAQYRQISQPAPQTALLHDNETIMDFSARVLSDYTQWTEIVSINNLEPPYVSTVGLPNTAAPGDRLLLPGPATPTNPTNYLQNTLGIDINFGNYNGDFPEWTGDFQVLSGYDNLSQALIRRILTQLGNYIYHQDYGSKLASLLGEPMSSTNVSMIKTYATSALLSDPRVQSILSLSVNVTNEGLAAIEAKIQPIGNNVSPTNLDLVLQSSP